MKNFVGKNVADLIESAIADLRPGEYELREILDWCWHTIKRKTAFGRMIKKAVKHNQFAKLVLGTKTPTNHQRYIVLY